MEPMEEHQNAVDAYDAMEEEIARLRAENERLRVGLKEQDWQNQPNQNPASYGAYEFYINEEWNWFARAAIDDKVDMVAHLQKHRTDPDDDRVRIRRVMDDDGLLERITKLEAENTRLRDGLVAAKAVHTGTFCAKEGCKCAAAQHNAAIDAVLGEQK